MDLNYCHPLLKLIKKWIDSQWQLLVILILLSTLLYSFVSIQKHNHFQTYAWDTSVFIQQLYFLKQFEYPQSTLLNYNILGDHFQVLFLLIGGISYFIWSDPKVLFVLQSLIFSMSAWPLYMISIHFLAKTRLLKSYQIILSLLMVIAYLFNVTSQSMLMDEFHNEPLVALPILFMLYFLITKNNFGYWLSLIMIILNKEIFGFLGIPLGLYIYLKFRDVKKAFLTFLIGLGSSYFLLFQLMPYLSKTDKYIHFAEGNTFKDLIARLLTNPTHIYSEFFNNSQKIKTIVSSLIYFGFLPVLVFPEVVLPVFSLAFRFFDDTTPRLYEFNNHYGAPLIPFVAFCGVVGLYNLIIWAQSRKSNLNLLSKILIIWLTLLIGLQNLIFHGPINSFFKRQFYQFNSWELDNYELINKIPDNSKIASQNSLLPHISERKQFYLLPKIEDAEYIAIDLEEGPNKFSPLNNSSELKEVIENQITQKKYQIIWQKNKAILLKKI